MKVSVGDFTGAYMHENLVTDSKKNYLDVITDISTGKTEYTVGVSNKVDLKYGYYSTLKEAIEKFNEVSENNT